MKRSIRLSVLTLAAVGAIAAVWAVRTSRTEDAPPASAQAPAGPGPAFAQPEQAERYRQSIVSGDERMLAVVNDALARARSRPDVDPEYVRRLERLRTERTARLEAYRSGTTNR